MSSREVLVSAAGGGSFSAYLALPGAAPAPAIVVLQEIFGINANIRSIAEDFAAAGCIAIAPDLFWRQQPGLQLDPASAEDRERATALLKGLDQALAVRDASAALDYARVLPQSNGKAAAVGFCLGGKLAYLMAARANLDAAVSYYGVGIQSALGEAVNLRANVLLHIAGDDHLCPPEAQAAIVAAMLPLGARVTIQTYPGVGHAFARRGGATFNAAATARAEAATRAFLEANLAAGRTA